MLRGGGLFVPEGFEKCQHPLPHVAAAAAGSLGYCHRGGTVALVTGERGEGGAIHGVSPFDLRWGRMP